MRNMRDAMAMGAGNNQMGPIGPIGPIGSGQGLGNIGSGLGLDPYDPSLPQFGAGTPKPFGTGMQTGPYQPPARGLSRGNAGLRFGMPMPYNYR